MPDGKPTAETSHSLAVARLLAGLAAVTLHAFRLESYHVPWLAHLQFAAVWGLVSCAWWQSRHWSRTGTPPVALTVWIAALTGWPFIVEAVCRRLFGDGDAVETLLLVGTQNASLGLAIFGEWRRFARASCLLSGFLVLFVTAMATTPVVFVLSAVAGFVVLWWLMTAYWERLEGRFATTSMAAPPWRLRVLSVTGLILAATAVVGAGTGVTTVALHGFMPTSGGDQWNDPAAQAGVRDGDMLVAAQADADSFGPVESDLFIESKQPSLYDAVGDLYGDPPKPKKQQDRTIALADVNVKQNHQRLGVSTRSGREFSAVRRVGERQRQQLEDRHSPAMFFVVGETPLHLALERLDQFDGREWRSGPQAADHPALKLEDVQGRPWIRIQKFFHDTLYPARQLHSLKITNLHTNRVPAPPHLAAVHVDKVDQTSFFDWTADGMLRMADRDRIPQLTVMHLLSRQACLDCVRERDSLECKDSSLSGYVVLPETWKATGIWRAKLDEWGVDQRRGWRKVERIVERLRADYVCDPSAPAPESCDDVVAHFLQAGRGPDYLFATTAAALIRAQGIPARLVIGFYADPRQYDSRARQTVVRKKDLHVWCEVAIDSKNWLPIEPTPGYVEPRTVLTWRELAEHLAVKAWSWLRGNWHLAAFLVCAVALCLAARDQVCDGFTWGVWWLGLLVAKRSRAVWTLQVLEWRARFAGFRRPVYATPQHWYSPLAGEVGSEFAATRLQALRELLTHVDRALYSVRPVVVASRSERTLRAWTASHFRNQRKRLLALQSQHQPQDLGRGTSKSERE